MQDKVELEVGYFSHLLNCLANQKYLLEMPPADRINGQMVIDEAWNKGMAMISPILQKNAKAERASALGQQKWMSDIDKIKRYCELDEKVYPQDSHIVFKWSQLVWQEVWMYGSLGEKIDPAEFHVLCERRGFTPRMSGYLSSILIHMELLNPTDAKAVYSGS